MPSRICISLISLGSRVKRGSTWNGLSAATTTSTQDAGISTRGSSSTISLTCTTTTPSWKAVASTMVGVSSVFGPVYRLPWRSACSAKTSATSGIRSTNIRA